MRLVALLWADTLDDACLRRVNDTTQLGDAQDKSSIAWILRISPLLIPVVWPKTGREWWRCGNRLYDRRRGEDTKRVWRKWGDKSEGQSKDDVLQSIEHADGTNWSTNTPLASPAATKSFRLLLLEGCIHSKKSSSSVCLLKTIKIPLISATWQQG